MSVNPADYNSDAINGEQLATLMQDEVYDRLKGDVPESIAVFLCSLKAQVDSIQKAISEKNLGECVADSINTQSLKVGGVEVKTRQSAKTNPTSSGTAISFVDSVTQNENGELTATRKSVRSATTSQTGVVQLTDSHSSTSTSTAATPKNVKEAYDLANGKADPASVVDSATYDSSIHTIVFKHGSTQLFTLDAAAFVKDGMVDSVDISNGNLVITFNTDAGKQPISIPLTDIFNPSNYYNKTEIEYALASKQNNLPYDSVAAQYGIDVDRSETVKLTPIVYGKTTSSVSSATKSVSLMSAPNESSWGYFAAILFENGNSYSGDLQLRVSFSRNNLTVERVYTVSDTRLKYIESGCAYLFLLDPAHSTEGKLVGEVNSEMSLSVNNAGTSYNFVSNKGNPGVISAYPYQSRSSFNDTFYNVSQSFTNGVGGALIKRLTLASNVVGLDWASQPETRWDFIDMTIRLCGAYKSEYSISETVTFELYISDGNNSYVIANLAEMSNYLFLVNDGLYHPFAFTLNYRMQYKEFLSRIGGQGKTLYLCFKFGATTSSSGKHQVVIDTVWTRAVFHGDHS